MPQQRASQSVAPTEPRQSDKSLGQLVSEMSAELSSIMRAKVQLAKVELKDEVAKAGKAGGMFGAGAVTGYFALLFASLALAGAVGDTVSGAASSVTGATSGVAGGAGGTLGAAGEQLRYAPQVVKQAAAQRTQGAPLAAGLIAFGAGALVAALVKGSETEGRIAQATLTAAQPLKDAATEAARSWPLR